ncbi:hypothetical protein FQR65_LT15796 [Abscondita terminalis]|nr:hypothetical protein FQR65_LT15796 [Abscondita terminalis]
MSNGGITAYNSINQLNIAETQQTDFNKPLPVIKNPSVDEVLIRMENVNPGECWQIKGHNGAGKSTLLSLINGDNPQAYAQQIYLFGKKRGSGESIWDIKKKIGFVSPELYNFFDCNTTVEQAIGSGFFDSIASFHWKEKQQNYCLFYRNGEQRLVIWDCESAYKDPVMLALDEPFQGLDDSQITTITHLLEQIHQNSNISMLLISHYDSETPMNFEISENLKMIAETARDFAEKNIRPHIMDWDESQHFPKDLFHQLASGKVIGAWGLTEHNTGSDAGGMSTTAVKDGDDWIINGAKNFITHAISGDICKLLMDAVPEKKGASKQSNCFSVLEKGNAGFTSELPRAEIKIYPDVKIHFMDDYAMNRFDQKSINGIMESAKQNMVKSVDQKKLEQEGHQQLVHNLNDIFVLAKALNYKIEDKTGELKGIIL